MNASLNAPSNASADGLSLADSSAEPLSLHLAQLVAELDDLEPVWNQLAASPNAGPFQTFAWNRAWYQRFSHDYDEMLVFSLQRAGRVVCILPCYRRGRELHLAADTVGDHQDILAGDVESARLGLDYLLKWARKQRVFLHFGQIREQAWAYPVLRQIGLSGGVFRYQRCYSACPYLELPDSLDAFLKTFPRKVRGDLKRHLNKLKRDFPEAKTEIHRAGEIPPGLVEEIADFHQAYFRKSGVSHCANPNFVAMMRDAGRDRNSGLRLSTLRNGTAGELMAVDVGFTHGGIYHGYLTTFDPKFRKLSPGNVLLLQRIDWLIREDGVRAIDFLLGAERYKSTFTRERYQVCSFYVFPANLPNLVRFAWKRAYFGSKYVARWLMTRTGLCACEG